MASLPKTTIFSGHEAIRRAEARIRPWIRETPIERALGLQGEGGSVWLKYEHHQITGSFKVRGALNKILSLSENEVARGLVTCSAGNHALGVAHAAELFGVSATVFVPRNVDPYRRSVLERCPIIFHMHGADFGECERRAQEEARSSQKVFLSAYDDPEVVAGQGTVGVELLRQLPDLDAIFLAVGGGGLLSGVAAYAKAVKPTIEIIGVSPVNSAGMFDELSGTPQEYQSFLETLADSTAGPVDKRSITIGLCRALLDEWILVDEAEIVGAMKYLFYEHRQVVEGSGALTTAAFLKEYKRFEGRNCALVVCGSNVAMSRFCEIL
jgi:threonine dehydratase